MVILKIRLNFDWKLNPNEIMDLPLPYILQIIGDVVYHRLSEVPKLISLHLWNIQRICSFHQDLVCATFQARRDRVNAISFYAILPSPNFHIFCNLSGEPANRDHKKNSLFINKSIKKIVVGFYAFKRIDQWIG